MTADAFEAIEYPLSIEAMQALLASNTDEDLWRRASVQMPAAVERRLVQKVAEEHATRILRTREAATQPRACDRWLDEDGLNALPDPTWLVEGLLPDVGLCFLVGQPGTFKSFAALGIASSMSASTAFLGHRTTPGPSIYVAAEGLRGMKERYRAQKLRVWEDGGVMGHTVRFDGGPLNLANDAQMEDFAEAVAAVGGRLVVIDTLARTTPGSVENDSPDMGRVIANLDKVKEAGDGCCVTVIHHSTKDKNGSPVRGSGALLGAADAVLQMIVQGRGLVAVKTIKMKDAPELPDILLAFSEVATTKSGVLELASTTHRGDAAGTSAGNGVLTMKLVVSAKPGIGQSALIQQSGIPSATARRMLDDLVLRGELLRKKAAHAVTYWPGEGIEI